MITLPELQRQVDNATWLQSDRVIALGGAAYISRIRSVYNKRGVPIETPFAGMPMGEQIRRATDAAKKNREGNNARTPQCGQTQEPQPAISVKPSAHRSYNVSTSAGNGPLSRHAFEQILEREIQNARGNYVQIRSGDLHRLIGGYPGPTHRMPLCCDVMRNRMGPDDFIVEAPPKGNGASLVIQYRKTTEPKPVKRDNRITQTIQHDVAYMSNIHHAVPQHLDLHTFFNHLPRYGCHNLGTVPFNNGIYVLFEAGERYRGMDRIVRVGSHRGQGNLVNRLSEHYLNENQRRSIFRKNIGRAMLNSQHNPYLAAWNLSLADIGMIEPNVAMVNLDYEEHIEQSITQYIRQNITFAVISINEAQERLDTEERLIATIASSPNFSSSPAWLGRYSPISTIRNSHMWLVQGLDAPVMTLDEQNALIQRHL